MMRDKKILVTGASGLLGAYLIQQLLHAGYTDVRAIRRPHSRLELLGDLASRVSWVQADILDIADLDDAMSGIDLVFHCAALVSFDPRQRKALMQVNVEGTANVVNAALAAGVKQLIHVSSIAALGRNKDKQTIDEKAVWSRSKWNSDYGLSKYLAEREVWRGMGEGLQVAVVNPSMILGSGRWEEGTGHFFSLVWNKFPFFPAGATGFVDARDVARFMVGLMEAQAFGKKYILNSENWDYHQFFAAIAAGLGKNPPRYRVNRVMRLVAIPFLYLLGRVSKKEVYLTPQTIRQSALKAAYDNSLSRSILNFEYTPVGETIAATSVEFLKEKTGKGSAVLLPV